MPAKINITKLTAFLLAHTSKEARLPKTEYAALKKEVGQYRDSEKGGLTKEAYALLKDNPKVVAAAQADRNAQKEASKETPKAVKPAKRTKERNNAPTTKDLVAYLNAHAGIGDRLPKAEYAELRTKVGQFRDPKKGGLTRVAFESFNAIPAVMEAAAADRKAQAAKAQTVVATATPVVAK